MSELTTYAEQVQEDSAAKVREIVSRHLPGQEGRAGQLVNDLVSSGLILPEVSVFEFRVVNDSGYESEPQGDLAATAATATEASDRVQIRRLPSSWVDLA